MSTPHPQKVLLSHPPPDDTLPPPYESDYSTDSDDDDDEPTTTLTINAPTTIHGSSNLVSLTPLDTARISTLLLAALNVKAAQEQRRGRRGAVNIAINCGVSVVGDRNVVGWVGGRGRVGSGIGTSSAAASVASPTESGAERKKRKADETVSLDEASC